ncbi:GNAT family N-acetyltransferase [uncultured Gammaproteobacteria bacterium]
MDTLDINGAWLRYRDTPWNDRALGRRCREILELSILSTDLLAAFEQRNLDDGIGLCVTRIPAENREPIAALQRHGYRYVEASYRISLDSFAHFFPHNRFGRTLPLRLATAGDLPALAAISDQDFHHGRFLEDIALPEGVARLRHRLWIGDLLREATVWVLDSRDRVAGFHAFKRNGSEAEMILTGVGRGYERLAGWFWGSLMHKTAAEGMTSATTLISAANLAILNLYSQLGFRFDSHLIGLHRHWPAVNPNPDK